MSTYYPIEFIPEISTTNTNLTKTLNTSPTIPTPQTRNYLRNNLIFEETNSENQIEPQIDYNKVETGISSSLTGGKTTYGLGITSNPDTQNKSNDKSSNIKERRTRVNIDSRLRNTQPQHILDTTLNNLENCLFFTKDSNKIIVYQPNHNLISEDKIIIEYATSTSIKIKQGLLFEKNSIYAKINHPNHNMLNNGAIYYINISNVVGNINSGTYLLNYPINLINKKQQVYFIRSDTDIFNPNYYYIKLDIPAEAEYTYEYSFNLDFLHIHSIPLNEINADYPITSDRINGYHVIENVINNNFYQISVNSSADASDAIYDETFFNSKPIGLGNKLLIVKVINTISGYPDNNNYIVNLQRNFYHVKQINLIDTIFPITEKVIKATPLQKQNNLFYWQNLNDGDIIYSVQLTSGNYTLPQIQAELTKQIQSTIRTNIDSTKLINSIYTYNTNRVNINIDEVKNTFEIQFYQEIILKNAIFKSTLIYEDGFTRIIVNYTNHNLSVGDKIVLSNVIGTEAIPTEYLNGTFNIETVIDANSISIKLDRFNDDTSGNTNGGTAIHLLQPIKSRLLFNRPNTIGEILGFYKVGDTYSVTPYDYKLTNYNLYEVDVEENSVGIVTQPRIDTRILNLSPNNYIIMLTDVPFNDQINLFDTSTYMFAKILLVGDNESYVYSQFIQCGSTFQEPLATLSSINFSFYDPNMKLYDFNNIEHSFIIEIIEQLDELNIVGYETG